MYLTKPVLLYGLTFNLVSPKCNTYPCQWGVTGGVMGNGIRTGLVRSHQMGLRVVGGGHASGNVGPTVAAPGEIDRVAGKKWR